ncbi:MAG TPA: heme peroxidase family protein [Pyrinomonadaceae bacterium]|jgi:hypothetical protein
MEPRNQAQQKRHARETIYLIGEGTYDYQGKVNSFRNFVQSFDSFFKTNLSPLIYEETDFRFSRMFKETELPPISNDNLIALGKAMIQPAPSPNHGEDEGENEHSDNSDIPAGYTFLGQFISHDISFDGKRMIFPLGLINLAEVTSKRSPTVELDSLYGRFSDINNRDTFSELYREDGRRFKVAITVKDEEHLNAKFGTENDLPRKDRIALIADKRNDENLGIAQMHVAFLRFHNAVVDYLEKNKLVAEDKLFETAREIVIKHYQGVILGDFLTNIVDNSILYDVIEWAKTKDAKLDWLKDEDEPFIPIEFSVAGFRFGHSVLQDAYDWNEIFKLPHLNGTFERLFLFTGASDIDIIGRMGGFDNLLGSWAIDWRRFFDFSKYNIQTVKLNTSRKIDPQIAFTFLQLPEFIIQKSPFREQNLASRNLVRGKALSLPTGEEVVAQMTAAHADKLIGKTVLTADEITSGPHETILKDPNFQGKTPLWYYILKEAEIIGGGSRLGTIGSYIVAETLVKLIQRSPISVFDGKWNSQFSFINGKNPLDGVEMADLIKFADSATQPLINPLG